MADVEINTRGLQIPSPDGIVADIGTFSVLSDGVTEKSMTEILAGGGGGGGGDLPTPGQNNELLQAQDTGGSLAYVGRTPEQVAATMPVGTNDVFGRVRGDAETIIITNGIVSVRDIACGAIVNRIHENLTDLETSGHPDTVIRDTAASAEANATRTVAQGLFAIRQQLNNLGDAATQPWVTEQINTAVEPFQGLPDTVTSQGEQITDNAGAIGSLDGRVSVIETGTAAQGFNVFANATATYDATARRFNLTATLPTITNPTTQQFMAIRFTSPRQYIEGDTMSINGTVSPMLDMNRNALTTGFFSANVLVQFQYNRTTGEAFFVSGSGGSGSGEIPPHNETHWTTGSDPITPGNIGAATMTQVIAEVNESINEAFAERITASTVDLTPGTSPLPTGRIYLVYEP